MAVRTEDAAAIGACAHGFPVVTGRVGTMDLPKMIAAIETATRREAVIGNEYTEAHALDHATLEALPGVGRGRPGAGHVSPGGKRGKYGAVARKMMTFRLLRRFTAPREARRRIRPRLRELGYPGDVVDELLVAVGEAMTNAVLYGAPEPGSQAADDITVTLRTEAASCVIEVTSPKTGWAVTPATCPDAMAPNGRGMFVIDRFTDAWKVTQGPGGTTISLSRRLPAPTAERAGRV